MAHKIIAVIGAIRNDTRTPSQLMSILLQNVTHGGSHPILRHVGSGTLYRDAEIPSRTNNFLLSPVTSDYSSRRSSDTN